MLVITHGRDKSAAIREIESDRPQKKPRESFVYVTDEIVLPKPPVGSNCFYLLYFALGLSHISKLMHKQRLFEDAAEVSWRVAEKTISEWIPQLNDIQRRLLSVQRQLNTPAKQVVTIVRRFDIQYFNHLVEQPYGMFMCPISLSK